MSKEMGNSDPIQSFAIGMEGSTDLKAARKVCAALVCCVYLSLSRRERGGTEESEKERMRDTDIHTHRQ